MLASRFVAVFGLAIICALPASAQLPDGVSFARPRAVEDCLCALRWIGLHAKDITSISTR